MKKNVVIAVGLAILSTSAYATKACINALGGDTRGSYYIQDTRNIFRNAAYVNEHTNYVITEWGSTGPGATAPKAEGGIFSSVGSLNYGVYLGAEVDEGLAMRTLNNGTDVVDFIYPSNRLQIFVGGDMGIKWGATAHYASNKDESGADDGGEMKNTAFGVGFGVISGALEGYANILLKDKSDGSADISGTPSTGLASDKYDADLGLNVGIGYSWMNYKLYGEYVKYGSEVSASTSKGDYDLSRIVIGIGHTHEVAATSRIFTSLQYENRKEEVSTGPISGEIVTQRLPLTFGFETDATSWLVLRGSISQNIVIGSTKTTFSTGTGPGKATIQNSTTVNTGATLNFGKLKVDGMVGTTTAGTMNTDELLANVGVHYWF